MRTTEAPDAVKQREKEQRDLEKSIERQKKEEAHQLAEAEKQKKKDEKEALQRQIDEQEQKLKEQARLLAEATKQNQSQQNNDVAAAEVADNEDSDDSLKGKLKGLFCSKKKKSSSKNNKKENIQPKVAEPVVPAEPLVALTEVVQRRRRKIRRTARYFLSADSRSRCLPLKSFGQLEHDTEGRSVLCRRFSRQSYH